MQDLKHFRRSCRRWLRTQNLLRPRRRCCRQRPARSFARGCLSPPSAQIGDQLCERAIRTCDPVDIDHRDGEARRATAAGRAPPLRSGDGRGARAARHRVRGAHRAAQLRQRVAARHRADQQAVVPQRRRISAQRARQVIDGIERADREHEVISRAPAPTASSMIGSPSAALRTAAPGSRTSTARQRRAVASGQPGSGHPIKQR